MDVSEANPDKRRIITPIYIADGSALATDAAVAPPVGSLKVSINGAAFVNASGNFVHIGNGIYYYEAALTEIGATGFLLFMYKRTGYKTEQRWAPVGLIFSTGETTASKLRLPLSIFNLDSPPALATGATVGVASDLKVSINGNAYANATGTLVEIGDGAYYYQGVAADAATSGQILVKYEPAATFGQSSETIDIVTPVSSFPDTTLLDVTAVGDLDSDPTLARWVPIHLEFTAAAGYSVIINAEIGSDSALWMAAYDERIPGDEGQNALAPLFSSKSVVQITGDISTGRGFVMDVIPNGGWQRPDIKLVPYLALELTQ